MQYAYYPGCSLEATGKPYDASLRLVFERLGIELAEIDDWNCCGATSYISMNKLTAYSISARNLAHAERSGKDVCAPCSSCYTILTKTNRHMRWDLGRKEDINTALSAAGLSYSGGVDVVHPLEILVSSFGVDKVAEKVQQPLDGLRIAPYYGCQIVRPAGRFDDVDEPTTMDRLLEAIGAEVVEFPAKVRCCGGMLMTVYEDVALKMAEEILEAAVRNRAELIVTTCPLCQLNLESYQERINEMFGRSYRMPIVYFTQALGIALGFDAEQMQLDKMLVEANCLEQRVACGQEVRT